MSEQLKTLIGAAVDRPLTRAEAESAFSALFAGQATPSQIGGPPTCCLVGCKWECLGSFSRGEERRCRCPCPELRARCRPTLVA